MSSGSAGSPEDKSAATTDLGVVIGYEAHTPTTDLVWAAESAECRDFIAALERGWRVHAIKLYRIKLDDVPKVPVLPCLDHEAQLHERIAPHCSAYVGSIDAKDLHEVIFEPARAMLRIDTISTMGEHSADSHGELIAFLRSSFPHAKIVVQHPSILRGDTRVMKACQAQASLRDVLLRRDFGAIGASIDRLRMVGGLMEKESRVASWSIRTITGPLLAGAGFLIYWIGGALSHGTELPWVEPLRYLLVTVLGASFLYLGLKAVHLTGMANRVWKRSCEYSLLLAERQRLERERRDAGAG